MSTPNASYLQTLPKDEATALSSSLKKIKEHLNQELEWMKSQIQHKTTQLEGIATLLSEVNALGAGSSNGVSQEASSAATEVSSEPAPASTDPEVEAAIDTLISLTDATDSNGAAPANETVVPKSTATETKAKRGRGKSKDSKPKASPKSTGKKTSEPSSRKSKTSAPASKASKASETRDFRKFLQSKFRDRSITDSVGEIVNNAKTPIGAKDVMAELYEGLSGDDYNRAKNSITNVLTVGKNQGKWKSTGRGLYASHALA